MRRFPLKTLFLLCIFALAPFKLKTQEETYLPIAAYGIDQHLWLYEDGKDPKQLADAYSQIHEGFALDLAWSPDGARLAYRSAEGALSILNINDDSITRIIGYPFEELPFAFTMASDRILFGVDGGADGSMGPSYLDIVAADLETGLPTGYGVCCIARSTGYGASFYFFPPPARVAGEELGLHISGWRFLEDTPFGILHSSLEGLQLSGETLLPISIATLSPDRMQIATENVDVNGHQLSDVGGIVILDLASKEYTTFETDSYPSLLGWGGNDVIFYTSTESIRDLYDDLSDEEKLRFKNQVDSDLDTNLPPYLPYNQVYIHQLNLSDGSEQVIYQAEAFTVGRLLPTPDGDDVYFTTLPNMDDWLENIVKGEVSCNSYECIRPLFPPSLYRLDLVSGHVDLIGVGLYRATINFGALKQ
jgi:hypothetical protein